MCFKTYRATPSHPPTLTGVFPGAAWPHCIRGICETFDTLTLAIYVYKDINKDLYKQYRSPKACFFQRGLTSGLAPCTGSGWEVQFRTASFMPFVREKVQLAFKPRGSSEPWHCLDLIPNSTHTHTHARMKYFIFPPQFLLSSISFGFLCCESSSEVK